MRIFIGTLEQLTPRRELYRVWVRVVEDGRTRLVARWIDSEAKTGAGDAGEEAPHWRTWKPGGAAVPNSPWWLDWFIIGSAALSSSFDARRFQGVL